MGGDELYIVSNNRLKNHFHLLSSLQIEYYQCLPRASLQQVSYTSFEENSLHYCFQCDKEYLLTYFSHCVVQLCKRDRLQGDNSK